MRREGFPSSSNYDQIGCGRSTDLPEKLGDEAFWSVELFVAELDNLGLRETGFHLLGQSWGGSKQLLELICLFHLVFWKYNFFSRRTSHSLLEHGL